MKYFLGYLTGRMDRLEIMRVRNFMLAVVPNFIRNTGRFIDGFDDASDGLPYDAA